MIFWSSKQFMFAVSIQSFILTLSLSIINFRRETVFYKHLFYLLQSIHRFSWLKKKWITKTFNLTLWILDMTFIFYSTVKTSSRDRIQEVLSADVAVWFRTVKASTWFGVTEVTLWCSVKGDFASVCDMCRII